MEAQIKISKMSATAEGSYFIHSLPSYEKNFLYSLVMMKVPEQPYYVLLLNL